MMARTSVEFRTADGEALATVCAGDSVRNLWRVPCVCLAEPSLNPPLTTSMGFPKTPARGITRRAGFSFRAK
jgi:hypothetical protein